MSESNQFSRPLRAAESLGAQAPDAHTFKDKRVMLEADGKLFSFENCRLIFLYALYILPRFCAKVSVFVPQELKDFRDRCIKEAQRIEFARPIEFLDQPSNPLGFDAVLRVGSSGAVADGHVVLVSSNGWLARISCRDIGTTDCSQANAVGALAAASWGCSEIFKILVNLKKSRGVPFEDVQYSLYEHRVSRDPGPSLQAELRGDVTLLGNGAIGNGVLAAARDLPFAGTWYVVDYQQFRSENLGTCILIGPGDIGQDKASVPERWSTANWKIRGFCERIEIYKDRVDSELPHPWTVLTAPDEIEPRRVAQSFWPDVAINGGIGSFGVEVGVHPAEGPIACIQCLFRATASTDYVGKVAKATGLTPERISKGGNTAVTKEDVKNAPEEHKAWLSERIGKRICAIAEERLAKMISDDPEMKDDFRPSLPFVATLSAAFMVGELVKYLSGAPTSLSPRIQHDILQGPNTALSFPEDRRGDCECVTRKRNIAKYRIWLKNKSAAQADLALGKT